jgi:hypothetical protein
LIPEQARITTMRRDVIEHGCRLLLAAVADWMPHEE